MSEHLCESAQVELYKAVRNRLFYPEGGYDEPEFILPEPDPEYHYEPTSPTCAWVLRLKEDAAGASNRDKSKIFIADCQKQACKYFKITRVDLLSNRRHRDVVRPRHVSMYLAKHLTGCSLPEIGRRHGDRDHTTVMYALRKVETLIKDDPEFRRDVYILMRRLGWKGLLPGEAS